MNRLLQKATAEAVGTFALVFVGCGAVMVSQRFPGSISPSAIPVAFGLVIAASIYALGHVSGAHFNPVVSLAFAIARHFPHRELLVYWLAQLTGAVLAMAVLHFTLPAGTSYGATVPSVSTLAAITWEAVLTLLLVLVIISVATDTRAEGTMAGAAIGAVVAACAYVGGAVSGASMNPVRSLASALFEGRMDVVWIYFVGPVLGAVLAAWLYEAFRCHKETKEAKGCC